MEDQTENKNEENLKISKILYENSVYVGEVRNGKRHGKGTISFRDGRRYEGLWENDLRTGYGVKKYLNGDHYVGHFHEGKAHGKGIYTWKNSDIYDGEWKHGVKEGNGMWKGINNESYIGEWKNSKADGYGVQVWASGDRYEGEWTKGLRNGNGTMLFANGDIYIGDHKLGKMHGEGQYLWSNGSVYIGQFKDGFKHGKGKWKKDKKDQNCNQYEGDYENDLKNGFGHYKWKSGNEYKGKYRNNLRHGLGEMFWTDGSNYKGMWHKGIQHGKGRMEFPDGIVKEGIFQNNIFQRPAYSKMDPSNGKPMKNSHYSSLDRLANTTAATFDSQNRTKYGANSNKIIQKNAFKSLKLGKNKNYQDSRWKRTTQYKQKEDTEKLQLISEYDLSNGSTSLCRERLSIEETNFNTYYGIGPAHPYNSRKQVVSSISTLRNKANFTVARADAISQPRKSGVSLRKKGRTMKRKPKQGLIDRTLNKSQNIYAPNKTSSFVVNNNRNRSKDLPKPLGSKNDIRIIKNLSKLLKSTQIRIRKDKNRTKALKSFTSSKIQIQNAFKD
ncbi:unnamed protein product [Moneuplotes crassus]|uniref:Phosphatidylinositol-4-phosphate 5-kinase n=1 Tax=Euplotes crassus TaxID=5936 RepID=A0AAD1U5A3_EUPCR|nr:unnamed protein product [Moneuplotes crassus]